MFNDWYPSCVLNHFLAINVLSGILRSRICMIVHDPLRMMLCRKEVYYSIGEMYVVVIEKSKFHNRITFLTAV